MDIKEKAKMLRDAQVSQSQAAQPSIKRWEDRTDDTTPGAVMLAMAAEIADLRAAKSHLIQQAQIWHDEAKAQRATVLDILRHFGLPENDWEAKRLIVDHLAGQSQATKVQTVPEGLSFDGYHDSDEHYGKTILDLVRARLEADPDDMATGDTFYVSAAWVQPQEWRVVFRNGGTVEVERVSPPVAAPTAQEVTPAVPEVVRRAIDVLEGLEGKELPGALPARVAKLRTAVEAYEAGAAQEVTQPTYWNAQRKMIERTIIGLRDGWATRKDAADALVTLAAATPVSQEVTQQAAKAETAEQAEGAQANVLPPFAAPASQLDAGWIGKISGGEYDRETGTMYITVKLPMEGLPTELLTIGGVAAIAPASKPHTAGAAKGGEDNTDNSSDLAPTTSSATASGSALTDDLADIARFWDGIECDLFGEKVDVGASLRTKFEKLKFSASAQASQAATSDAAQLAELILADPDGGYMRISSDLEHDADGAMRFTVTNPDTGKRFGVHLGLAELKPEKSLRTNPATPASKGDA